MSFKLVYLIPFIAAGAGLAHNHFAGKASGVGDLSKITGAAEANTQPPSALMTDVKTGDKDGSYVYKLDAERITLKVTETSFISDMRRSQGGLTASLAYFDEKAVQKFEKRFKNSSQCPASFFNRNSKNKNLIATSPLVKAKLKRWKNLTWKNTSEWYNLELKGQCVTGASSYIIDGGDITSILPSRVFSKCKYFYVEDVVSRTPYLPADRAL